MEEDLINLPEWGLKIEIKFHYYVTLDSDPRPPETMLEQLFILSGLGNGKS